MSYEYPEANFKSVRGLSNFVVAGLGIIVLTDLLQVIFVFAQIVSPDTTIGFEDAGEASVWLMMQSLVHLAYSPAFLFTVTMFLIWINSANKNLTALRADYIEFSSGWAVGWWFIPFLNLIRPFQVVREIWCESDPDVDISQDSGPKFLAASMRNAPAFIAYWWGFWILRNISANIAGFLIQVEIDGVDVAVYAVVVSGILAIIAGILAIMVVRRITERQEKRFQVLGILEQKEPPPPPNFASGV